MVAALRRCLIAAGYTVEREKTCFRDCADLDAAQRAYIMDLVASHPLVPDPGVCYDVTVVTPLSQEYLAQAQSVSGAAAEAAGVKKDNS